MGSGAPKQSIQYKLAGLIAGTGLFPVLLLAGLNLLKTQHAVLGALVSLAASLAAGLAASQLLTRRLEALREAEQARLQKDIELAMLHQIASSVSTSLDLNEICHQALERILVVMDLQIGMVHLGSVDQDTLGLKSHLGLDPAEKASLIELPRSGSLFKLASSGGERAAITLSSERITQFPELQGVKQKSGSLLLAPLHSKGDLFGLLTVGSRGKRGFVPDELQLFRAIAGQISVAIANARLFEEVSRQAEEIEAKRRKLIEAQERLIEAERRAAVGQIGVAVRHEINNPLTAILGHTQLLLRRWIDLPEDVRTKLQSIEELTMRIRDIVRKLEAVKSTPVKEYAGGELMIDLERVS